MDTCGRAGVASERKERVRGPGTGVCAHACRAGAERTAYVEDRHEHGEDGQTKDALHADGLQRRHVVLAQEALLHDELRGRKDLRAEHQRNAELIAGHGSERGSRGRARAQRSA